MIAREVKVRMPDDGEVLRETSIHRVHGGTF